MDGDAKIGYLQEHRILNPKPDVVRDEQFRAAPFFDPRDLLQVKYEMLRRVLIDGESATQAAADFGFSRTAYYQILASFRRAGLPGLIPDRPGPHGAHKLTEEVVEFLESRLAEDETLPTSALVALLQQRFRLFVHPRSVERAIARRKKGR
jgi:transposase